jgi:hypothetical protein
MRIQSSDGTLPPVKEEGDAENLIQSRQNKINFNFMKRYLLGAIAIVTAVGFSAFTVDSSNGKRAQKWFSYKDAGSQIVASNYNAASPVDCPGADVLCAILVEDANNDNILQQSELDAARPTLDPDSDGNIAEHGERQGLVEFKEQ